jgi:hypothetical protein
MNITQILYINNMLFKFDITNNVQNQPVLLKYWINNQITPCIKNRKPEITNNDNIKKTLAKPKKK